MRTIVYVDGFNLYYALLKGRGYKWLDLKALASQLVPRHYQVTLVKYFTARVSGAVDPQAPRRQSIYLKALKTMPDVEVHFGNFLAKTIWRPIITLPVGNETITCPAVQVVLPIGDHPVTGRKPQTLPVGIYPTKKTRRTSVAVPHHDAVISEVHTMEEKGSDVNLAAHLVNDACIGAFDAAVVISNDTDLVTPVRMAVSKGRTVIIGCPNQSGVAPKLRQAGTYVKHIRPGMIRGAQLPNPIPGTTISKPVGW